MKKLLVFSGALLFGLFVLFTFLWIYKEQVVAHQLSKELHAPVTLGSLSIDSSEIHAAELWVGTPKSSKTPTSFQAETILIDASLFQLFSNPLVIDQISLSQVFIGLEFYQKRHFANNWAQMLAPSSKKESNKKYLIRTLILRDLTVQVTTATGQTKVYPKIDLLELHDISSETGFPIKEIEKAIFQLVIQHLFDQLNIKEIFESLPAPFNLPFKLLPFGK